MFCSLSFFLHGEAMQDKPVAVLMFEGQLEETKICFVQELLSSEMKLYAELHANDLVGSPTIAKLYDIAAATGEYQLGTSNCHHAALAVFGAQLPPCVAAEVSK